MNGFKALPYRAVLGMINLGDFRKNPWPTEKGLHLPVGLGELADHRSSRMKLLRKSVTGLRCIWCNKFARQHCFGRTDGGYCKIWSFLFLLRKICTLTSSLKSLSINYWVPADLTSNYELNKLKIKIKKFVSFSYCHRSTANQYYSHFSQKSISLMHKHRAETIDYSISHKESESLSNMGICCFSVSYMTVN